MALEFYLLVVNGLRPFAVGPFGNAMEADEWADKALDVHTPRVFFEGMPITPVAVVDAERVIFADDLCPDCDGKGAFAETGEDCGRCFGGGFITADIAGAWPAHRAGYRIGQNMHANIGFFVRPDDNRSYSPIAVYPTAGAAWAFFDAETMIGKSFGFTYPAALKTLPDYTAHSGQAVKVLRQLSKEEADQENEPMFEIEAADGWRGHADYSELED